MIRALTVSAGLALLALLPAPAADSSAPTTSGTSGNNTDQPATSETGTATPAAPAPATTSGTDAIPVPATSPEAAADAFDLPPASGDAMGPDANPLFADPIPGNIPLNEPLLPDTSQQENLFAKSKTAIVNDELKRKIRYRQAKTRALETPEIQGEWERALDARTEPERRDALRSYYKLLFERIEKADASLKPLVAERRKLALQKLNQRRIRVSNAPGGETWAD